MGLLEEAVNAWQNLQNKTYDLLLGRKNKSVSITISFEPESLNHLVGFQYAKDIDFQVRKSELFGDKLIAKITSGTIRTEQLELSRNWFTIKNRLEGIINLESTLDSNFTF